MRIAVARLACAVLACLVSMACAQEPTSHPRATLADLAVLEDVSGTDTIADVAALAAAGSPRFRPLTGSFAGGFTRSVHWFRFTIDGPPGAYWLDLLPPYLDDLRLYEPDAANPTVFHERRAGDLLPFSARETPYRGFAFRLALDTSSPHVYFLRLQTVGTSIVLPRVWSDDEFHQTVAVESGVLLGLIAVLLTVVVLNLVTWFWMRERVHLLFIVYLLALTVLFFGNGGFAAQYLVPNRPGITDAWVGVASLVAIAMASPIYRELITVNRRPLWVFWLYRLQFWVPLLGIIPRGLGWHTETLRLANGLLLATVLVGVVLSTRPERRRVAGGRFLVAAIVFTLTGAAASTLQLLGLTPGQFLQLHSLNVAAVGGVLTLHVAIGARYRALRDERLRAAEEAARERETREQQGRFVDLVTHEYRTPLSILQTNVDILGLTTDADQARKSLEAMRVAIARLRSIFDDPLRHDAWGGLRRMTLEPVDLAALIRDVAAQATSTPAVAAHRIDLRAALGPAIVAADERLLATVFLNLIDNAGKYSRDGGTIDIAITREPGATKVTVANECAADPSTAAHDLGQKYTRGANSVGTPGLGMGLYLAKKIMADLGGHLDVRVRRGGIFVAEVVFGADAKEPSA